MKKFAVILLALLIAATALASCAKKGQTEQISNTDTAADNSDSSMDVQTINVVEDQNLTVDTTDSSINTDTVDTATNKKTESTTPSSSSTPTHTHSFSAATCTQPQKCSCGATQGAALGHSWDSGVVTEQATVRKEGIKTYTCTRCNATKTESIPQKTDQPNPREYINAWDTIAQMEADMADYAQSLGITYDYSLNLDNSFWSRYAYSNQHKTETEIITVSEFKEILKDNVRGQLTSEPWDPMHTRVRAIFFTKDNMNNGEAGSWLWYVQERIFDNEIIVFFVSK